MLKKILATVGFLMLSFALLIAMQPSEFKITRSLEINAPAEKIFNQVNILKNWDTWSPWAKLDPKASMTFSGPESGVGASFSWAGNDQVGEGSITITESIPNQKMIYSLVFTQPFTATNNAEFIMTPSGSGTKVTWSMSGNNNFMAKAFSLFFDCEKIIGPQFEVGLKNLKAVSVS